MTMLKTFFEKKDEDNKVLFTSLKIWQQGKKYRKEQGKYPVIFLTLKSIKSNNFNEAYSKFKILVSDLYKQYKIELYQGVLKNNYDEQQIYQEIIDKKADKAMMEMFLQKLSEFLHNHYNQQVIILIDEYDTPINTSYGNNYYQEMIDFMREFLSAALKDNCHLYQAILTGILQVAKESIFSGLNNLRVYSLLSNEYGSYFGFLQEEVKYILKEYKQKESLLKKIEYWYGGYIIGDYKLYNPWSVVNFIKDIRSDISPSFKLYWINTSGNDLIENLLNTFKSIIQLDCKKLSQNKSISKNIDEHIIFKNIKENECALWSFLLLSGYLTPKISKKINEGLTRNSLELLIPNNELYQFYTELVKKWFEDEKFEFNFKYQNFQDYIPIIWNIGIPNPYFIDRKDVLELLRSSFEDRSSTYKTQVIIGLGGIGKTQFALAYAHNYKNHYQLVWVFHGESTIEEGYRKLAIAINENQSNLNTKIIDIDSLSSVEICHKVKDILRTMPDWLIIFDDITDENKLIDYLPQQHTEGKGHIIITSRMVNWQAVNRVIQLDVFSSEEAMQYLQLKLKSLFSQSFLKETDLELAVRLAKLLGYLPLALAQAASFILENRITFVQYIKLLEERDYQKLFQERTLVDYNKTISVTWDMSMQAIKQKSQLAFDLLIFCSYLYGNGITEELLEAYVSDENNNPRKEILEEALTMLNNYSMLIVDRKNKIIFINSITQKITREKQFELKEKKFLLNAVKIINEKYPYGNEHMVDHALKKTLQPHLEEILKHLEKLDLSDGDHSKKKHFDLKTENYYIILNYLFDAYKSLGNAKKQKELLERALVITETHYGKEHIAVAMILNNLANAYGDLGDFNQKKALLVHALKIIESHYGKEHVEIAATLNNLATAHGDLGDVHKCKELLERALKIKEAYYGKGHVEVSNTLINLGNAYGILGDALKQKKLLERALKIKEAHYGKEHVEVARILDNLANAYGDLGDAKEKKILLERASRIIEMSSENWRDSYSNYKSIDISLPHNISGDLIETIREKIKSAPATNPQYALLLKKLADPSLELDSKNFLMHELIALRKGIPDPNLQAYLKYLEKNPHVNIDFALHIDSAIYKSNPKQAPKQMTEIKLPQTTYIPTLLGNSAKDDNPSLKKETALSSQNEIRKNYAELEEKKKETVLKRAEAERVNIPEEDTHNDSDDIVPTKEESKDKRLQMSSSSTSMSMKK